MKKQKRGLAVTIPRTAAKRAGVRESDTVNLALTRKIPTLAELVAQITPENRHPEIPVGTLKGREN